MADRDEILINPYTEDLTDLNTIFSKATSVLIQSSFDILKDKEKLEDIYVWLAIQSVDNMTGTIFYRINNELCHVDLVADMNKFTKVWEVNRNNALISLLTSFTLNKRPVPTEFFIHYNVASKKLETDISYEAIDFSEGYTFEDYFLTYFEMIEKGLDLKEEVAKLNQAKNKKEGSNEEESL